MEKDEQFRQYIIRKKERKELEFRRDRLHCGTPQRIERRFVSPSRPDAIKSIFSPVQTFTEVREGYSKDKNATHKLSKSMSEFINHHEWSHWCTFTFSEETTEHGARRQLEKCFNRFNDTGLRCLYFVIEKGGRYDRIHAHAIGLFKAESSDIVWNFWKASIGRCQVRAFKYGGGAVEYIANYFQKGTIDWDFLGKAEKKALPSSEDSPITTAMNVELYRQFQKYKNGELSKEDYIQIYKRFRSQ